MSLEHVREMTEELKMLGLIDEWYKRKCDGSWEHQFGLTIESTDNPGWLATIDMDSVDLNNVKGWNEGIRGTVVVNMSAGKICVFGETLRRCMNAVAVLMVHDWAEKQ